MLEFEVSQYAQDYWKATVHGVSYTVVGPRPALPEPWPEVRFEQYWHVEMWTASRMPNDDFLSAIVGKFYLTRHATFDEAKQACENDFEALSRVWLWFEFMKINDVRQLLGRSV